MNFDFKQFYLSGKGRVNWQQFWLRLVLPGFIISVVLMLIDLAIGTYDRQDGVGLLSGIFSLLILIPAILIYIKRWHDRDKSGWWNLIVLIPIVGTIWFLVELGFLKGTPGLNRFGPPVTD